MGTCSVGTSATQDTTKPPPPPSPPLPPKQKKDKENKEEEEEQCHRQCIVCLEKPPSSTATSTGGGGGNEKKNETTTTLVQSLPVVIKLTCRHEACRECIKSWIERCEQDGHDDVNCPHCRQIIEPKTIQQVLGRTYQRQSKQPQQKPDEFTNTWLESNSASQCTNCGMWMMRENYQNEPTACMCGYVYCWTCKKGLSDGCKCRRCEFYDPMTDKMLPTKDYSKRFPIAGPEHFDDLTDFMIERRTAIYRWENGLGVEEEEEDDEEEEEEGDNDEEDDGEE